ncbi:unnamed protein product [Tilletia controversa]|uniref:Methyltransferase type 11 domain-containing protein n=2 Tax=Tilletia TaxID=13289 RepID=A0A8X7MSW4_9BASI|nr:hypothetical protein CF336_g4982 [Tilletia laevis]KAE8194632.1 hypothetical protein CF328_g4684 [Tilletia controversa]CAD7067398.1 unnamed protein product [Tilletia caries]KAE8198794.1 hypothetical protein CF335_g4311 [Tilletia laevis]KAE8247897.1 hypothetical protein A4X06_0g4104 [Tilletia controversa]
MATFSKSTFDAASYLAFRPSYPPWLYDHVLAFHRSSRNVTSGGVDPAAIQRQHRGGDTPAPAPQFRSAWDLGCGPGISTIALLPHFGSVKGLEPSANMVANALRLDSRSSLETLPAALRELLKPNDKNHDKNFGTVDYVQGNAEDLDKFCKPASADLIIAAQAAHWFSYDRLWPSLSRSIAPGGTVAFWCYAEFGLPDFPEHATAPLISAFMSAPGRMGDEARALVDGGEVTNVGGFFEQPGRTILERGLVDVPWPWEVEGCDAAEWDQASASRSMHSVLSLHTNSEWPPIHNESQAAGQVMDRVVSWDGLERYLRTASAVNNFLHQHPDDKAQHAGRDVVQRFVDRLRENVPSGTETLRLRWPLSLMMVKAR